MLNAVKLYWYLLKTNPIYKAPTRHRTRLEQRTDLTRKYRQNVPHQVAHRISAFGEHSCLSGVMSIYLASGTTLVNVLEHPACQRKTSNTNQQQ